MNSVRNQKKKDADLSREEIEKRQVIAFNFNRLMEERGFSPTQLAEAYGCSEGYISGIRNNHHHIGFTSLQKWAVIFGVSIFEFGKTPQDILLRPLIDRLKKHPDALPAVESFLEYYLNQARS